MPGIVRRISPTSFRVARRGTSREINRQIALNLIRSKQPVSRAELARLMGVRRGAVSRLVDELLETRPGLRGRQGREPPRAQAHAPLHRDATAVRGGGGREREPHVAARSPTCSAIRSTDVVEFPTRRAPAAARQASSPRRIEATPGGPPRRRRVHRRRRLRLGPRRRRRPPRATRRPWAGATWTSSSRCARRRSCRWSSRTRRRPACSARSGRCGATRPVDGPVAFVNVSDGVGVGIAVDGKLLRGAHNAAGEIGHVPLNMYGPRCACGQRGCLGGVHLEARGDRPLPGHRPVVAAVGRDGHRHDRAHHGAGPGRRGAARSRRCARPATSSAAASRRSSRRSTRGASTSAARSPRRGTSLSRTVRETLCEDAIVRETRRDRDPDGAARRAPAPARRGGAHRHARVRGAARVVRSDRRPRPADRLALAATALAGAAPVDAGAPIDREALVGRHRVVLTSFDTGSPLSVGNGELAFTADATGLQTFAEAYDETIPLGTLSQWGWHTAPNPRAGRIDRFRFTDVRRARPQGRLRGHPRRPAHARDRVAAPEPAPAAPGPHRLPAEAARTAARRRART